MTHEVSARRRGGFTLVETIVTIGLLAVLAAFVVPSVIQKAGAGDPVKVVSDVAAIRTGLETFRSDLGGYPNQLRMMTDIPTTSNHLIDSTTGFTASQAAIWNGPYLAVTIGTTVADSVATGYAGAIKNFISRYDGIDNAAEFYVTPGAGTGGVFTPTNTLFAALTIVGLTTPQAEVINRIIDGPGDADVATGPFAGANVTGHFRFDKPNANGAVVAYYLAVPLIK